MLWWHVKPECETDCLCTGRGPPAVYKCSVAFSKMLIIFIVLMIYAQDPVERKKICKRQRCPSNALLPGVKNVDA